MGAGGGGGVARPKKGGWQGSNRKNDNRTMSSLSLPALSSVFRKQDSHTLMSHEVQTKLSVHLGPRTMSTRVKAIQNRGLKILILLNIIEI